MLRATGQVVLFPGYLALYEEGRDEKPDDEEARACRALREGDAPAKTGVDAEQHFTQPPPRFSEARLVKRLEELGIGRPSTYASTLQTLKDRDYVRVEKNRFFPRRAGGCVTAFLERFFETLRQLRLHRRARGRARRRLRRPRSSGRRCSTPSGATSSRRPARSWSRSRPRSPRRSTSSSRPGSSRRRDDGSDPRLCPHCGNGRLALRGGKFGAFIACSNYPECKYTQQFGQGGDRGARRAMGRRISATASLLKIGPLRPLCRARRASAPRSPRTCRSTTSTLEMAERLLSLPREIGAHPETGKPITASIGRYGPYLAHDGKYAKLGSTAEVFETGMNAAVAKLADAAAGGGRQRGASREPITVLGQHPAPASEIKVMEGRYGPYVTDGTTNATLPKGADPKDGDAGGGRAADRRARRERAGEEEGRPQARQAEERSDRHSSCSACLTAKACLRRPTRPKAPPVSTSSPPRT